MKLTKKILNEHGIYNPHNLATKLGNKLYIGYTPADMSRAGHSAKWQVVGLGFRTNPKAHWTDYGCKTFDVLARREKYNQLNEAVQWVSDTYHIGITDRDPFGIYHPKGTLDKLSELIESENKET